MIDSLIPLVLTSLKTLLLVVTAGVLATALRRRPARLRAVVWGTALVGTLIIPVIAPLLPSWSLPIPIGFTTDEVPDTRASIGTVEPLQQLLNPKIKVSMGKFFHHGDNCCEYIFELPEE